MKRLQLQHLWLALGLAAAGLVAGSLILTAWPTCCRSPMD